MCKIFGFDNEKHFNAIRKGRIMLNIRSLAVIITAVSFLLVSMPAYADSDPAFDDTTYWHEFDWSYFGNADFTIGGANDLGIDVAGSDIWTSQDQYAAYYLDDISGDFEVVVKIISQENTDGWAKAGIMVRNDITGDAESPGYCIVAVTPSNGYAFQWDNNHNGMLDKNTNEDYRHYPCWLRLVKTGQVFSAYFKESESGTWDHIETETINSAATVQDVGLFVTSHNTWNSCLVEFQDFQILPSLSPPAPHTITASAGANGTIDPIGGVVVNDGADQTFNVVPNTGYRVDPVDQVTVDGGSATLTDNQYTFLTVSGDHTISVTFTPLIYTITATAGSDGTISPLGDVPVSYGQDQIFEVTPDEGYEVDTVLVGLVYPPSTSVDLIDDQYTFENVMEDHYINVTFVEAPVEGSGSTIPGCGSSTTKDYSAGFVETEFEANNIGFTGTEMVLETGNDAINPDSIIIPFEQEVAVTFMYEGAGYESDFGWMLKQDAVDAGGNFIGWANIPLNKRHPIFRNIHDENGTGGDGILDLTPPTGVGESDWATFTNGTEYPFTVDGDGTVTPKDMKKVIGTFAAGTEIIFFLTANRDWDTTTASGVFFNKTDWNPDVYGTCTPTPGDDNWINESTGLFHKDFKLGLGLIEGSCQVELDGWMAQAAVNRLDSWFDVTLNTTDVYELEIQNLGRYAHVIVGAPADDANQWILGWEDLMGGGDADFNDMVFRIERKTGGIATLKSEDAIVPGEPEAYFTAVTFRTYDNMPCSGSTSITYELSIDNGDNWVSIEDWDEVIETDDSKNKLSAVSNWTPGSPQYTYRSVRIDFSSLGHSGRALIWRATLVSENEACNPSIKDVELFGSVSSHGSFARSSPIMKANLLYAATYEMPDMTWTDKSMRGHLTALRLYDPTKPSDDSDADGVTDVAQLWDAGEVLSSRTPSTRNIKIPDITVNIAGLEILGYGDGSETTFTGTLAHAPVCATTVQINGTSGGGILEKFIDKHTDVLEGDKGGTGTINRYNGEYSITFNAPVGDGVPIVAYYQYYTTTNTFVDFTGATVTNAMLGIDSTFIYPDGYIYDFDGNGSVSENDGDWLVDWIRGYKDGTTQTVAKQWPLGPLDHSVPALETPPGTPPWYFGTAVPEEEREAFDTFMADNAARKTVVYVGSRDGMLHAFDAGEFRHGDNTATLDIEENRGYFLWENVNISTPVTGFDHWWSSLLAYFAAMADPPNFGWTATSGGAKAPNYGTGEELWAFIPNNLIPRLKYNLMQGEDQAYVDASPALSDVYIDVDGDGDKEWRTVLLAAEGNGGDTIFCLDVTDPENPTFLWEFADPDLFRSRSSPAVGQIGRINDGGKPKWVAFFVSGKTDDHTLYPSIYMINVENGEPMRVFLDEGGTNTRGQGGVPSGQPAIVDADYNGYHDRMYIGTDKGLMYKITLPDDPDHTNNVITHCVINDDFDVDDDGTDDVDAAQQYHPIYGSPVALINNTFTEEGKIAYRIRIFFGTGDSPYYDENINVGNTKYHFFAYVDQGEKDDCSDVTLDWAFELPEGHRIFSSAFAAAGQVYFGTSTAETDDPCDTGIDGNLGRLYGFTVEGTMVLNKEVGNVSTTPLVEDQHLFYLTPENGLSFLGSGQFNNDVLQGGEPEVSIRSWRIVE